MLGVEERQLAEDRVTLLATGVPEHLAAGNHLIGDSTEPLGDADAHGLLSHPRGHPGHLEGFEEPVTAQQIIGDHHDHGAQLAVGAAHERTVAAVDLVALVAGGIDPCATGNRLIICVIGDRTHLASEFGGRHDADSGNAQEHHVCGVRQESGHFLLQLGDMLKSAAPLIVKMYHYCMVHLRILCGILDPIGPVQDFVQGAALIAHIQRLEDLGQSFAAQFANLRGRLHTAGDGDGCLVVENVVEETGIPRQKNIKKRNNLIAQ